MSKKAPAATASPPGGSLEDSAASAALVRLLQTAFNRQTPASKPRPLPPAIPVHKDEEEEREKSASPKISHQNLYQALDRLNHYKGPEESLYSDYSDGFYSAKPYKHRDDRLLQAFFRMLSDERQ